jgi:O-antigen/teichoic acid export membrane protein
VFLAVTNGSRQLMTVLATMLLARGLAKAEFGVFQEYALIVGTVTALAPLGLSNTLYALLPIQPGRERDVWFANQVSLTALGIFGGLITYIACPLLSRAMDNELLLHAALPAALSVAAAIPALSAPAALLATGRIVVGSLLTLGTRLCWLTAAVVPLWLWHVSVIQLLWALAGANILTLLVTWVVVLRQLTGTSRLFDVSLIRMDWELGGPVGISSIVGTLAARVDRYLVAASFDPVRYAVFSVGAMEIPLVSYLSTAIYAVMTPEFAAFHRDNNREAILSAWRSIVAKSAAILIPAMGLLFLVAERLFTMAFTAAYAEASSVFLVYLLVVPARVISFSLLPLACLQSRVVMKLELAAAGANLALSVPLLLWFGPLGAAAGTVLTFYGVIAFGYVPWYRDYFGRSMREILPTRTLGGVAASTATALAIAYLAHRLTGALPPIVSVASISLVFFVVAYLALRRFAGVDWYLIVKGATAGFRSVRVNDAA